jgi:hypothetical protein
MSNVRPSEWADLSALREAGRFDADFDAGFANGRAFLAAADALCGRYPRIIEWTGGRRAPGDEVVPSDLRVDHVYFVSCKYLSKILHNPSPARLFEGLLTQAPIDDLSDWYGRVASSAYQRLYDICRSSVAVESLPPLATELAPAHRKLLKRELAGGWPPDGEEAYADLCREVSSASALAWSARITDRNAESVLWRLLRVGSTPYFILGTSRTGSMRLRIETPWDWRQSYSLKGLDISARRAGQPVVAWCARYDVLKTGESRSVQGHVEIRWSHGRFGQRPEAKVYLDTLHEDVPGYHLLQDR